MSSDNHDDFLPPTPGPDNRPHIYVMNSDPAFLEMIGELLDDVRAHVTLEQMRPNVEVSLENLRSARPDLLILDIVPRQRNTTTLLEHMERDKDLRHLPVMVASTSPALAEAVGNAHGDLVRDVLPKPFDLDTFYARIANLVSGIVVR